MKFLVLFAVLAAFVGICFAFKNKVCNETHSANGNGRITCLALMPRWTFDQQANKCAQFIYGGCGGNGNQFDSKEQCIEACVE